MLKIVANTLPVRGGGDTASAIDTQNKGVHEA
jgi:hypothetical protein